MVAAALLGAAAATVSTVQAHDSRILIAESNDRLSTFDFPNTATTTTIRAVQRRLASYGYSVVVDGVFGPQTARALRHWQHANQLPVTGLADAATIDSLDVPATTTTVAVRTTPPVPDPGPPPFDGASSGPDGRAGRCVGAEPLLAWFSPGWDVVRMSHVMRGESGCQPGAYNRGGQAAGLLQITPINYGYLSGELGFQVTTQALFDPVINIRAAAALWRVRQYRPWSL